MDTYPGEYEPPCPRPRADIPAFPFPTTAAVVLRRPASNKPSRADRQIYRLLNKAAASRDTVPWWFFVAGPDGYMPLFTRAERERFGLGMTGA